jgi:hypothetical protein
MFLSFFGVLDPVSHSLHSFTMPDPYLQHFELHLNFENGYFKLSFRGQIQNNKKIKVYKSFLTFLCIMRHLKSLIDPNTHK